MFQKINTKNEISSHLIMPRTLDWILFYTDQNHGGKGSDEDYIIVKPLEFSVNNKAQQITFSIESNVKWKLKSDSKWCKISSPSKKKGEGNSTVTLQLKEHTGENNRTAQVTVSGNDEDIIVSITQSAFVYTLELFPAKLTIDDW